MIDIKPKEAKDRIILALDVDSIEEVKRLVDLLKDYVGFFKVGMQLFTACGYEAVEVIRENGGKVYFDCKFQDIPNTVEQTSINIMKRGVDFFNISATGGSKMMTGVVSACNAFAKKIKTEPPIILAVTLLSSFGQKTLTNELGVEMNISSYVFKLAQVAKESGVNGVVVPYTDAGKIKQELGESFIVVCPAVRPTWAMVNDQIRIVSPTEAIKAGVDYMVIGRPITMAHDPVAAVKLIIAEIEDALNK